MNEKNTKIQLNISYWLIALLSLVAVYTDTLVGLAYFVNGFVLSITLLAFMVMYKVRNTPQGNTAIKKISLINLKRIAEVVTIFVIGTAIYELGDKILASMILGTYFMSFAMVLFLKGKK